MELRQGDRVLILKNKMTIRQPYDPDPYTISRVVGTKVRGERRGKPRMRNIDDNLSIYYTKSNLIMIFQFGYYYTLQDW